MSENEDNQTEVVDAAESEAAVEAVAADELGATINEATPVTFGDLPEGAAAAVSGGATLELLYDLSLPITVELGRAALKVQDVLALGEGSVVRLDRIAGDPVDVYVGTKKLAQAEVVVLDEQFGIRITHIYPDPGSSEL